MDLLKEKTGEQLAKKVSPPKQASGTSMPMPGATQKQSFRIVVVVAEVELDDYREPRQLVIACKNNCACT